MDRNLNSHAHRALSLIRKAIKRLELDLSGKTVLTEIGSNNYLYTPFIPLLAGASRVVAWTADTTFANSSEIKNSAAQLLAGLDVKGQLIIRANEFNAKDIAEADIITNSGFLRPLNADFLSHAKKELALPVMYEAWEIRKEDIDVDYCKDNRIKIAGTWENHPALGVFSGIGPLAVKLCQEAGYEVYQNTIIIWSDDHFGDEVEKTFLSFGAHKVIKTTNEQVLYENIASADFIFIADYDERRTYFGKTGFLKVDRLKEKNESFGIIHLYGAIDADYLSGKSVPVYPTQAGYAMRMTRTLGYLGLMPIINLQVGGFRVAQHLIENTESDLVQKLF